MYDHIGATARQAYERGDQVLQLALPLSRQAGSIAPMVAASTTTRQSDVTTELNRVVRQGWSLLSGSVVFVQTGEVSRDKFLSSGQQVAVSGDVVGYYLFTRDESKRQEGSHAGAVRRSDESLTYSAAPVRRARRSPSEVSPLSPLRE